MTDPTLIQQRLFDLGRLDPMIQHMFFVALVPVERATIVNTQSVTNVYTNVEGSGGGYRPASVLPHFAWVSDPLQYVRLVRNSTESV